MSCRASIRRRRTLIPGRSTCLVPGSQINPRLGYKGGRRNYEEVIMYINSADRDPQEDSSNFLVQIPNGPIFPANARVMMQVFAASIPNTFYYLRNEYVKITRYPNFIDLLNNANPDLYTAYLNGVYNLENENELEIFGGLDLLYPNLYYDIRTKHIMNRSTTEWLKIEVSTPNGRIPFGFPDEVLRKRITSYFQDDPLVNVNTATLQKIQSLFGDENIMILAPNPDFNLIDDSLDSTKNLKRTQFTFTIPGGTTITTKEYPFSLAIAPRPSIFIPSCYYISTDIPFSNVYESTEYSSLTKSNMTNSQTLCSIPVSADYFSVLTFTNDMNMYQEITNLPDLRHFQIVLTDENGIEVMPDMDWSVGIRIRWDPEDHFVR